LGQLSVQLLPENLETWRHSPSNEPAHFCKGNRCHLDIEARKRSCQDAIKENRMLIRISLLLGLTLSGVTVVAAPAIAETVIEPAFPGAVGWASETVGGRGGQIIRVTNLNADGPGSLKAAIDTKGPRTVVFEVAGQIDLGKTSIEIKEPFLTIAGQTAPSPGITIIKGGIDVKSHDIIIRHIRVRTGAAGSPKLSGWEADSISTVSARNVILDHNTFMWGIDENMSASGPRFTGSTLKEWRDGTSRNITFSYNLAAEGLADSATPKASIAKARWCTTTPAAYYSTATSGHIMSNATRCLRAERKHRWSTI
jgi:hypothetical protein